MELILLGVAVVGAVGLRILLRRMARGRDPQ
jgi:hypothetical protein